MNIITVQAPAKVNLTLDVLARRPDGYHELDMLMQALNLYESVTLQKAAELSLVCRLEDGNRCPGVPEDERNLAWRAAALFLQHTGLAGGVQMEIVKRIPAQAGMAGGSADAAGVLFGMNLLFDTGLTLQQLCALGEHIGADVPFCLTGGTARVQGIGEKICPVTSLPPCYFVVAMPTEGCSTPQGFAAYDHMGSPVHPNADVVLHAIENCDLTSACAGMGNALQEVCISQMGCEALALLRSEGALASLMTGSGAAVYGVFEQLSTAQRAQETLLKKIAGVYLLQPVNCGPIIK